MSFLYRTLPGPFRWVAPVLAPVGCALGALAVVAVPGAAPGVTAARALDARVDSASSSASSAGARTAPWSWPTTGHVVLRPFDADATEYGPGHRGIDIQATVGTAAHSPAAGTVAFTGQVAGRPVVTVDHGEGLVSSLDPVAAAPGVEVGTELVAGSTVGSLAGGHCAATDPCLHLGARVDGRYVDPLLLLPRAAWPVLLPLDRWP